MILKIKTANIHSFLKGLNDAEQNYLIHIVNVASSIRDIIRTYKLSKERFCEELGINKRQYNDYIAGSRNYDLMDMAKLNTLSAKMIKENASKHDPVKVKRK